MFFWWKPKAGVAPPTPTAGALLPEPVFEIAFDDVPTAFVPTWTDLSDRPRAIDTTRGRSYEFNRMEAGTMGTRLDNRDAALSPENSASPYAPIISTRQTRVRLTWENVTYPLFRGISEGFPQTYPSLGQDALVELHATDPFYALNTTRFTPGSTTLTTALASVAQDTSETITVDSTLYPMPQVVPFDITVAGDTAEQSETMSVTEIVDDVHYVVTRSATSIWTHSAGAAITTLVVSFPEESSGARIQRVLEAVGFNGTWYNLDEGQSLIADSEDLANVNPLEHINLVADTEFGRFFVAADGRFTFKDRHAVILDYMTAVLVFRAEDIPTGTNEVPFLLTSSLEHSEEKLYNRVRITIKGGAYDGEVVDVADDASIAQHFEHVFERTLPYANLNDAQSAAEFVLLRNSEATLRLPSITTFGAKNPAVYWPLLLSREIGDRAEFNYQPEGGGDAISMDVAIDGIEHRLSPGRHDVTFRCTEVDSTDYWILDMVGFSELDQTTRVGF